MGDWRERIGILWSQAFQTTVYLINRLPTPVINGQCPFYRLFKKFYGLLKQFYKLLKMLLYWVAQRVA